MEKVLWELLSGRLVAIVRGVGPEEIVDTARALAAGGIRALEITFDHTRRTAPRGRGVHPSAEGTDGRGTFVGAGPSSRPEEVDLR